MPDGVTQTRRRYYLATTYLHGYGVHTRRYVFVLKNKSSFLCSTWIFKLNTILKPYRIEAGKDCVSYYEEHLSFNTYLSSVYFPKNSFETRAFLSIFRKFSIARCKNTVKRMKIFFLSIKIWKTISFQRLFLNNSFSLFLFCWIFNTCLYCKINFILIYTCLYIN